MAEDTSVKNQPPAWTTDFSILWRDGNWQKLFPNAEMSPVEKANAVARLGLFGGGALTFVFGSTIFVGLGLLLLLLSGKMIKDAARREGNKGQETSTVIETKPPATIVITEEPVAPGASSARLKKYRRPRRASGHADGANKKKGAQVARSQAAHRDMPEMRQVFPKGTAPETEMNIVTDENLVPISDVYEFQSGDYTLRSPFPRPMLAGDFPGNEAHGGPWAGSSPYQTGFPTEFGPAPTAIPPSADQFVRNVPGHFSTADQQANALVGPSQFQAGSGTGPTGPETWGAFMSDGGNTSTPITAPVPSGTVGSNFSTNDYTPRNLAQAGEPLPPMGDSCFPPDQNNLLGNPPVQSNRVARPKLCTPEDPRSDSEKFLDGLYESPATQAAGYSFFPFPVQDMVEARDNFQQFVISEGQTHFKDKWSGQEQIGMYNITDTVSELGY